MTIKKLKKNELTYSKLINYQIQIKQKALQDRENYKKKEIDQKYEFLVKQELEDFQSSVESHSPIEIEMLKSMYAKIKEDIESYIKSFEGSTKLFDEKNPKIFIDKLKEIYARNFICFIKSDKYENRRETEKKEKRIKNYIPTKVFVNQLAHIFLPLFDKNTKQRASKLFTK